MAIQPPLACAKSSPSLLPTDSILQDLPYLPDLPDLPELQDHSEQSENETNLDFDRKIKSYSQDISKRPVTLPSPAGDTKVDDESTLKIGQDDTYTVPSSETDDSHQMPEEDLREELLKVLEKRSDLHQNLKESLVKCSLSLASYSNCRENLSKCSLELARVINGSVNKSSAHQDPGQKSCRSIEENLSTKGLLSYSNIDANQKSCELNKLPLIQSQLRISRDKLEPEFEEEFEDLVCLKSALFEVAVALSVGKVWRGLEAEQKAAYDKAIRFGPSSFNANPSGHWQDIQKFTAAIFNIIQELRAVENSTKRVDFYSIFCGTEKQPEFGGLHDDSDELLLLNKTEHASGHKLCIEPKFDLPPTPDTNKLQRSSDVIHPISNIEVDISRQKEVLQSILSSLNASEKVLQEPRKVGGPEMSAAVVQEVTKRDAFHAAITNFAGLSSIMATELKNLKSQVKTVQDMIIKRDQNEFDDQASNTDNKDKADVDAKSVNPVYEAIQHKELDTTDLNTDESTLDGISKPNDIPEKEIGLAALTKFNTNTLYTPWCLNLGGNSTNEPVLGLILCISAYCVMACRLRL
ncbi:hypothetical protein DID88_000292 [Monilinia fructigena]|uniref:Uncharacterized protein n=1 Tax=Monilinia fructigena TaxID=38457 RepID=A0A395IMQ1_9HELO|nr:hypothetical protein DID88_000292 [Monilinia fructigena]